MCIPPWSQTLQCATHRRVRLHGVHHTAESSSVVCIPPRSQAPVVCITPRSQVMNSSKKTQRCASHRGVWFRSVHHTLESITYQVSVLIWNFTNAISLWCLKIFYEIDTVSQNLSKESFYFKVFRKKEVKRCSKFEITKNGHFQISLTPRCDAHCGVKVTKFLKKLSSMHPTAESDSAVCFPLRSQTPRCASHCGVKLRSVLPTAESSTPQCQNPHRGVKIKIFTSLWVPLKGQSGEILSGVNNSIM